MLADECSAPATRGDDPALPCCGAHAGDRHHRHGLPRDHREQALPAVPSDANLRLDPLHPTAQGHRVLAERAADELADIGFVAKR